MNYEQKQYKYYIKIGALFFFILLMFLLYIYVSKPKNKEFNSSYIIKAEFSNQIDGIYVGSEVMMLGFVIGEVVDVDMKSNYHPVINLKIDNKYKIPDDSVIYIYTDGWIGDKYVEIEPGANEEFLKPNDIISFTQGSMVLEDMLSKANFNKGNSKTEVKSDKK